MAKPGIDEVEVLRFFETEPLEKATVLFRIVSEKMRVRLRADNPESPLVAPSTRPSRSGKARGTYDAQSRPDQSANDATPNSGG